MDSSRLGEFVRLRASTEINIVTKIRPFRFEHDMADLVIHYGSADWAHAHVTYLMDEEMAVLASPALLAERPIRQPTDLAAHTLLQHTTRPEVWNQWLTATQTQGVNGLAGPRFEHYALMAEAAAAGMGVALLPAFLLRSEIERGTLVIASPQRLRSDGRYYIVYPTVNENNFDILAFRDWLVDAIHRGLMSLFRYSTTRAILKENYNNTTPHITSYQWQHPINLLRPKNEKTSSLSFASHSCGSSMGGRRKRNSL